MSAFDADRLEHELREAEALLANDVALLRSSAIGESIAKPAELRPDTSRSELTEVRRRQIISELWKERESSLVSGFARRSSGPAFHSEATPGYPELPVSDTLPAPAGSPSSSASSGVRVGESPASLAWSAEDRNSLIDRLLRERKKSKHDHSDKPAWLDRAEAEERAATPSMARTGGLAGVVLETGQSDWHRRPHTPSRPRVSEESITPFSRVSARAERKRSKAELAAEVREQQLRECTFQPKINDHYRSRQAWLSREERLERLAARPSERAEELARRKAAQDQLDASVHTFKPKLPSRPRGSRSYRDDDHMTVSERLYVEASERAEMMNAAKIASEAAELKSHPFAPTINHHSAAMAARTKPLHERVGELQRDKNEYLMLLKAEVDRKNSDLTFNPCIPETSAEIIKVRREEERSGVTDVTHRLLEDAQETVTKRIRLSEAWNAKLEEEWRFVPEIPEISSRLVVEKPEFQGANKDFLARQRTLDKVKALSMDLLREKADLERAAVHPFKPAIGNAEAVLVHTRPDRLGETVADGVERLSRLDTELREDRKEHVREAYYQQFDFKPKVNRVSAGLARAHEVSTEELTRNERHNKLMAKLAAEKAKADAAEMPFRPCVPSLRAVDPASLQRLVLDASHPESLAKKMEQYGRDRAAKLEEARRIQEFEEMRDCTFAPEVERFDVAEGSSARPVIVRGLGRYLELKELAKRQEQELRWREEKVFHAHPAGNPHSYTIPQPFRLHGDAKGKQRREKSRLAYEEEKRKECTYRPRTTGGVSRSKLQRLLDEHDGDRTLEPGLAVGVRVD